VILVKKIIILMILIILLSIFVSAEENIIVKGCLLDELTKEKLNVERVSISDGKEHYYFETPEFQSKNPIENGEIINKDGCFELIFPESYFDKYLIFSFDFNNYGTSLYGGYSSFNLQKNKDVWLDDSKEIYKLALTKNYKTKKDSIIDISSQIGDNKIEVGNVYLYPQGKIFFESDINVSLAVNYYPKFEGPINGCGNGRKKSFHVITRSVPLNHTIFIQLEDLQGNEYISDNIIVPSNTKLVHVFFIDKVFNFTFYNSFNYSYTKDSFNLPSNLNVIIAPSQDRFKLKQTSSILDKSVESDLYLIDVIEEKEIKLKNLDETLRENKISNKNIIGNVKVTIKGDNNIYYNLNYNKPFKILGITLWKSKKSLKLKATI